MNHQETVAHICGYLHVEPEDVVNIYPYGSRVYGTASETSDLDYVIVFKEHLKPTLADLPGVFFFDYVALSESEFEDRILAHDNSALECLWLPSEGIVKHSKDFRSSFVLDLPTLRQAIASKASNSFVKAKKKLTVEKDLNPYIAKKSLFHSLRILIFGMQIASYGRIINYAAANRFWYKIRDTKSDRWEDFKTEWQPIYNRLSTTFRVLAPKEVE